MSFIGVRPRKGVSSYSYVLTSEFRLANNRELNTTFVEAIDRFCFGESSSWRIYTTPVNENQKRKTVVVQWVSETFYLFLSQGCISLPEKEKATLSHRRACAEFSKLVIFIGSFLQPANSRETIPLTGNADTDATDAAKAFLKTYDYIFSNWKADEE